MTKQPSRSTQKPTKNTFAGWQKATPQPLQMRCQMAKCIETARLKSLLEYKDGNLYWKIDVAKNVKAGDKAGCKLSNGYTAIKNNDLVYAEAFDLIKIVI